MRRYRVVLEFDPEASLCAVVVPALPGCTSAGGTIDESLTNAREAIRGHIASLEAMGAPVPEEREGALVVVAAVAASHHNMCGRTCLDAAIARASR